MARCFATIFCRSFSPTIHCNTYIFVLGCSLTKSEKTEKIVGFELLFHKTNKYIILFVSQIFRCFSVDLFIYMNTSVELREQKLDLQRENELL